MDNPVLVGLAELQEHLRSRGPGRPKRNVAFKVRQAAAIRAIREELRMTQVEFAEIYGFPLGLLQEWERNEGSAPNKVAYRYLSMINNDPVTMARISKEANARPLVEQTEDTQAPRTKELITA